jgi:hypothetical protein
MVFGRLLKALLALALVAAPVVRDACLFMCQTPKHASAAGAPSCHHTGAAGGTHLRAPGAPCEHGSGPHENRITAREESRRGWRDADRDGGLAIHDAVARAFDSTSQDRPPASNLQSLIPNRFREVPLRI